MGADLYDPQCAQARDRLAVSTPRPQGGAAGIGQKPGGGAERPGVVEDLQAHRSAAVRRLDQPERSGSAQVNGGQAPSDGVVLLRAAVQARERLCRNCAGPRDRRG
jgi:hypothetical protein